MAATSTTPPQPEHSSRIIVVPKDQTVVQALSANGIDIDTTGLVYSGERH